jgi:hypothetical protein
MSSRFDEPERNDTGMFLHAMKVAVGQTKLFWATLV